MKKLIPLFAFLIAMGIIPLLQENEFLPPMSIGDKNNPNSRAEYDYLVMRDPVRNEIPAGIRRREAELSRRLRAYETMQMAKGQGTLSLNWEERGPDNIGGRSRVFATDIENPGVLIAGGVGGGIWKSTDDGASWRLKLRPEQSHSTSCIAQDTRSGKSHIWYVGTGEFRGSTTNNTRWGSFYHGDGIYKSTDNGETWEILPSTASGTPHIADEFDFIWNLAVNPANTAQDEVYAATWRGIYRSTNGGETWAVAKASDPGTVNTGTVTTDVIVTPSGVIYAHTRESGVLKLWRSADGVNWSSIAPANFPTSSGRIVMAYAPSDENIVYIFVQSPNNTPAVADHQLWKYTHSAGGGTWENRAQNLPDDLSTQSGYDQTLHIKPDNPNFILIGGTNLYRSTDGFTSTTNTEVIGGYPYYPEGNHHPDIQGGAFKPANSNIYYSATDGGLHRADNISMTGSMVWTSLNNGYNVTQVYSVAISPDSGDNMIVAGAQDNGSLATDSSGLWYLIYGGDGTVLELPPASDNRIYTQYQSGPFHRQTRSQTDIVTLTPGGSTRALFVNPIALDPNNSNLLYYAAGKTSSPVIYSGIWRNSNITQGTTSNGWTALSASDVGSVSGWTRRVSAIGVSKENTPNTVYIGTTDGIIKRIENAHSDSSVAYTVTPPNLNGGTAQGGFVRCIAVDPKNSMRALAAFGNYNFQSLWLTTDGGSTWADAEGNIGGPDGPSVRWATFVYSGSELHVFIGTSVGLLMTTQLQGSATEWVHAAQNEIGNVLIAYMDYRESDRTLAVGTHGRGVFTVKYPLTPSDVQSEENSPSGYILAQNYPNPFNGTTRIHFTLPASINGTGPVKTTLRVYDITGTEVAALVDDYRSPGEHHVDFDTKSLKGKAALNSGVYIYQLIAGNQKFSKKMILLK